MCTEPSRRPARHSSSSRTSRTTSPSGSGFGTPSTAAVGTRRPESVERSMRLLQQTRHAAVGEGLATGLAGRAVLQAGVGEADLADRVTAHGAGLARPTVHREVALLLALQLAGREPARAGDGV